MIKAKPTRLGRFFWKNFCKWGISVCFHDFRVEGMPAIANDKGILLMGNHISWWDGFWPIELNRRFIHKNFYVMMLEEQLAPRPFMRQGGAFSIDPKSRSMVESIRYAAELLDNPATLLLMYPQGEIRSIYDRDFQFQPGVEHILRRVGGKVQVIFFVAMIDYQSHARPTLTYYLQEYSGEPSTREMVLFYDRFYQECLIRQTR